jgi:hypothetical protein
MAVYGGANPETVMTPKRESRIKNSLRFQNLIVGTVVLCSVTALGPGVTSFRISDPGMFSLLLTLALAASRFKVSLPRVEGSVSMDLPFILMALATLSLGEAIVVAGLSAFVQCVPSSKRIRPIQLAFNIFNMMNATALAGLALRQARNLPTATGALLVAAAAAVFLLADTVPVAAIIAVTESMDFAKVWQEIFSLTFPYFVLSAGVTAIVITASLYVGWCAFGALPVMYGVYCSYRKYWKVGLKNSEEDVHTCVAPAGV